MDFSWERRTPAAAADWGVPEQSVSVNVMQGLTHTADRTSVSVQELQIDSNSQILRLTCQHVWCWFDMSL